MSGKGSTPRPFSVDKSIFDSNWDAIFTTKQVNCLEYHMSREETKDAVDIVDAIQFIPVAEDETVTKR